MLKFVGMGNAFMTSMTTADIMMGGIMRMVRPKRNLVMSKINSIRYGLVLVNNFHTLETIDFKVLWDINLFIMFFSLIS